MDHGDILQCALDIVDNRITERITSYELAKACGYSAPHLGRLFSMATGMTLMAYVTRRKLQHAVYDLASGQRIIDVAMTYGFETHAGFTKAFRKCFGYPPSVYRIHVIASRPRRVELGKLKTLISGGEPVHTQVLEAQPFTIVGYVSRHKTPQVKFTHDIPAYWETIGMNYWEPLTLLHQTFNRSRHCEYTVCFDIDPASGEFSYLLGVGVDNADDMAKVKPDMTSMDMPGGVYAKFTTPLVKGPQYAESIRNTWKAVFDDWFPKSGYMFDEGRYDFEYYDERDHNEDGQQMDIYVPVRKRQE